MCTYRTVIFVINFKLFLSTMFSVMREWIGMKKTKKKKKKGGELIIHKIICF